MLLGGLSQDQELGLMGQGRLTLYKLHTCQGNNSLVDI